MIKNIFIFLVALFLLINCSSTPDYKRVNDLAKKNLSAAETLMKEGKVEEAYKMLASVKDLHPNDARVKAIIDSLTPEQKALVEKNPWLGFNKATRAGVEATTGEKIMWYIPDRIMDFVDMFGFQLNVGPQLGVEYWATHAIQANAFVGATSGVGYNQKKMVGVVSEVQTDLSLLPFGLTAVAGTRLGSGGIDSVATTLTFHKPSEKLYQDYRDYWGVGYRAGLIIVGFEVEYHPIEILDFFGGFVLIDFLNDDLATTRRLRFSSENEENLKQITKALKGGTVKAYQKQFSELGE